MQIDLCAQEVRDIVGALEAQIEETDDMLVSYMKEQSLGDILECAPEITLRNRQSALRARFVSLTIGEQQ